MSLNTPCSAYSLDSITKALTNGDTTVPHVLISLALEEEQLLDFDQCRRWLQGFPALAKHATVQGIYRSNSTLVLLSVPVAIWDWLPDDPACAFIGYVHSQNLLPPRAESLAQATERRHVTSQALETRYRAPNTSRTLQSRTSLKSSHSLTDPELVVPLYSIDEQQRLNSDFKTMSVSDRSSMASSVRTWNTASTRLTSFDFYPDHWKDNEFELTDADRDAGKFRSISLPVLNK